MNPLRILAIPHGSDVDKEGRKLGDDWLIADFGETEIDNKFVHIYVTTDRVHLFERLGTALTVAELLVDIVNEATLNTADMKPLLGECAWAVGELYPYLAGRVLNNPDDVVAGNICRRAYELIQRLEEITRQNG